MYWETSTAGNSNDLQLSAIAAALRRQIAVTTLDALPSKCLNDLKITRCSRGAIVRELIVLWVISCWKCSAELTARGGVCMYVITYKLKSRPGVFRSSSRGSGLECECDDQCNAYKQAGSTWLHGFILWCKRWQQEEIGELPFCCLKGGFGERWWGDWNIWWGKTKRFGSCFSLWKSRLRGGLHNYWSMLKGWVSGRWDQGFCSDARWQDKA